MIRVFATSIKTFIGFSFVMAAASASAVALETITLENLKLENSGNSTAIRSVEFVGTNLSREEVQKLFTVGTLEAEASAILSKLVASRITIPEIIATSPQGKLTISAVQGTDIDTGKIGHITVGGFDGAFSDATGPTSLKSGPIALDGAGFLGVFKAIKSGSLGANSTHFGHISWQGFEMSTPDKDTPAGAPGGNLIRINLGTLSADGTADGDVPLKTVGAIKNFTVELPPASEAGKSLAAAGYPVLDLGLTFSSTYNPSQKTLTVDDLTLSGGNAGSLGLKIRLGGIEKNLFIGNDNERTAALLGGNVSNVELRFINAGAAEKALAYAAGSQGKTPAALKTEASAMAAQMIPVLLGGNPISTKIAEQVSKFIGNPSGLTISAKPKLGSIGFLEAMTLTDPASFLEKVDVTVLAQADAGSPPATAPSPAPLAPAAAAAPASRTAPAAAEQVPTAARRLTAAPAWNSLIGNSVSGKNSDGEPLVEYYMANGTVKQLDGDDIATGKWALRGSKICFEYPDDEEESCYSIVVEGNIATFTDEDGAGQRYEVLKGNPKRL